jgi:hypothetical protein
VVCWSVDPCGCSVTDRCARMHGRSRSRLRPRILKDDQGKTIVIPTKNILDKEVVIESGPAPAIQERAVEENRGAGAEESSTSS